MVSFLVFIDFAHTGMLLIFACSLEFEGASGFYRSTQKLIVQISTETSIDSIHIDDDIAISGKHLDPRQTLNSDFFFTAQWFNPTAGTTFNLEQSESDTDLIFQIKTFQTIPEIALILCQLNPGGNPSIIKIDNIISK